ncbi:MAG: hypothetical protein R3Y35_07115 [Clostridia bacterium]
MSENKQKKPWFLSFNKKEEFVEEDDIYYGIQHKNLIKYKDKFDDTGELKLQDQSFKKLFDSDSTIDEEAENNFKKIQKERRRRVAQAVETAGVDFGEIEEEFGIVAPIPVTSEPVLESVIQEDQADDFSQAILNTAQTQTVEVKLNVFNDMVEVQNKVNVPEIDEETINKILEKAKEEEIDDLQPTIEVNLQPNQDVHKETNEEQSDEQSEEEKAVNGFEDIVSKSQDKAENDTPPEVGKAKLIAQFGGKKEVYKTDEVDQNATIYDLKIPLEEIDKREILTDVTKYRKKNLPLHTVNMDILQQIINSESKNATTVDKKLKDVKKKTLKEKIDKEEKIQTTKDDYNSPEQAREVAIKLKKEQSNLTIKCLLTGAIAIALLIFTLINEKTFTLSNVNEQGTLIYLAVNLTAVIAVFAVNFKAVLKGIFDLFKFKPSGDSTLSLAIIVVIAQIAIAFLHQDLVTKGYAYVYGLLVVTGLFLNLLGKVFMTRRIYANLRFVTSREQKYAVKLFEDGENAEKFAQNTVAGKPVIAYQKKTSFLKNFLEISYKPDPTQTSGQALTPLCLIFSLILCMVSMIIYKDIFMGVSVFAAASCVMVAMGNMIAGSGPINKISKKARRTGAMISSYKSITQMSKVNAIMVDCSDLFPAGSVILDGLKTYSSESEEECIHLTVSLLSKVGGTLADVIDQIIEDDDEELAQVSNIIFEEEHGVTASVDGKKVLIGNRTLLLNHNISVPNRDEVVTYTAQGKKVVFVAIEDKLRAMIILTYKTDSRKKSEVQNLEKNGISLLIRSTDPNITENMICDIFEISQSSVNIVAGDLGQDYSEMVDKDNKEFAFVATKGRAESMMSIVSSCIKHKRTVSLIVAIQIVGIILGLVLVTMLAINKEFSLLSSMNLFIYQLFWTLAALIIPRKQ